jgi:hypothetical protein
MPLGGQIAGFNGVHETHDYRFGRIELVRVSTQRSDTGAQFVRVVYDEHSCIQRTRFVTFVRAQHSDRQYHNLKTRRSRAVRRASVPAGLGSGTAACAVHGIDTERN